MGMTRGLAHRLRWWLVAALAVAALGCAGSGAAAPSEVTPPVLRYGLLADFAPFQMWPEGGPPGGADLVLLQQVVAQLGLVLVPVRYERYADLERDLEEGRIDVASSVARSTQRESRLAFSASYAVVDQVLVARAADTSAPLTADLGGRRIAVVKGFVSESTIAQLFPLARQVEFATLSEALRGVADGRADVTLEAEPAITQSIERDRLAGLQLARPLTLPTGRLHFAVPASQALLARRLSEALDAIGQARVRAVVEHWMPRKTTVRNRGVLAFDRNEQRHLAQMAPLVIGVARRQPPFTFVDESGNPAGLSVDVLKAVLARLGVRAASWRAGSAPDIVAGLESGEIDIAIGLVETAGVGTQLRFVGPFLEYPMVLVGRPTTTAWSLEQLVGRRLAVPAMHFARPLVDARYPGIRQVPCADMADCIDVVARGEADAALSGLAEAAALVSGRLRGELQIVGAVSELRHEHAIAVSRRDPALPALLRHALDAVAGDELIALKPRWLSPPPAEHAARAALLRAAPWVAGAGLALLAAWGWHARRLHVEVRRTRQAMVEAERHGVAARRFVTFLAHEVRSSLHSVIAGTELLRSARQTTPVIAASLGTSARATLALLNALLDRERLEAGRLQLHFEPAGLGPILGSLADEMRPAALAKGVTLTLSLPADDALLQIDAMRVQQVVRNLVSNAIKYSGGGEVRIEARSEPRPGRADRRDVEISVRDEGPGLSPEEVEQLFQPFFVGERGKSDAQGSSGLGLALCRDLARLMHGELRVKSSPGAGTTVSLHWTPRVTQQDGAERSAPRAGGAPPPRSPRILVLEDAEVYAMLLERALQQRGFAVVVAATVAGALQCLGSDSPPFDALLCDVNLTDGDAFSFFRTIAEQQIALPPATAAMSAEVDDELKARLLAAGVNAVVQKVGDVGLMLRQLMAHPEWRRFGSAAVGEPPHPAP